ncbi:imidazolonepropionase [Halobacteriovorax marinus]|uniref:imidazolonepropionase n=1 Tax=Halobacteriovorax marinus TaxID=97084 RepID=UPI000BC2F503|nr:imidazolonepropionase [Halobacteriovorax marinus]ATH09424.1 imidazolonepropionase [Halobacteriovorax marinus]
MSLKAFRNFSQIVTLENAYKKDGRHLLPEDLSIIENASIVFDSEEIVWVGEDSAIPSEFQSVPFEDFTGKTLLPELVDSHTHLVFGGDRSSEYSMRLNGADYQAIANAGGGILSTMKATNESSADQLFEDAVARVERIYSYGVGTIEIKSGYGLNYEKEKECSLIIERLKDHFEGRVQISNTYMAAHAVPKEYKSSNDYINKVVIPLLKELSEIGVIDAVDIFHEEGYFDEVDTQQLFDVASFLNIPVKSHADEFKDNKGAILAVKNNALSTDHLLCTTEDGISALASSSTVATLLPGTGFFLGKPQADAEAFFKAGVKVAIASDYNPGSCHCDNVLLVASLAAPTYKMNIAQLWAAITMNAAHALNFKNQGALVSGLKPRFTIFDVDNIDKVTYHWGVNKCIR